MNATTPPQTDMSLSKRVRARFVQEVQTDLNEFRDQLIETISLLQLMLTSEDEDLANPAAATKTDIETGEEAIKEFELAVENFSMHAPMMMQAVEMAAVMLSTLPPPA